MMKKMLALVLTLCLLCGAAALAEEAFTTITDKSTTQSATTTVKLTVEGGYTVTIPASVDLDLNTRKGSGNVVIAANPVLEANKTLYVYLESLANANGAATYLALQDNPGVKLYYRVYNGASTSAIFQKTLLLTASTGDAEKTATLNFVIPDSTQIKAAGTYTDTLTFSIVVK